MFTELMLWLMNCLSLLNHEKKQLMAKPSRQRHGYETADFLSLSKLTTNLRQNIRVVCKMMM